MKVLIIGATGMLGHTTLLYLKKQGVDVSGISSKGNSLFPDLKIVDVLNEKELDDFFSNNHYDLIINCAALLIEDSDKYKFKAAQLNSAFPHWLEERFRDTNTKIIQVSTDAIFEGEIKDIFLETSKCTPVSFYSKTKWIGEIKNEKDLTIRSAFFGPDIRVNGKGLLNWFLKQCGNINAYENVVFSGVTSLEFAKFVYDYGMDLTGIYNLSARKEISKGMLLRLIKDEFDLKDITIIPNYEKVSRLVIKQTDYKCGYTEKEYSQMIKEIKEYIIENKKLYEHYFK